jgi:hypothetical protein
MGASSAALAEEREDADLAYASVVTFGPGDHPFSKFGHDALWLHDPMLPRGQQDLVFNYGTFRFDSPWLILDFLEGKLSYWLSISTMQRTLAVYRAANRTVSVQRLALSPAKVRQLAEFLRDNAKPEKREYRYDYYRDNCATRIRDALDKLLEGRLAAASKLPAPMTWREHTRRLTVDSPGLYLALDLAMGPLIDKPLTEWEAMFLPDRVAAKLAQLEVNRRPLVASTGVLFEAERAPTLSEPPGFRWGWLAVGVSLGACLFALGCGAGRWVRVTQASVLGLVGTVVGVLGTLLWVLWLFTDHDVTYYNRNVLLCPIWGLAFPLLAVGFARQRPRAQRLMMLLVVLSAVGSVVALLLAAVTVQSSGPALSLFLPLWVGAAAGTWQRCGRPFLLPRRSSTPT